METGLPTEQRRPTAISNCCASTTLASTQARLGFDSDGRQRQDGVAVQHARHNGAVCRSSLAARPASNRRAFASRPARHPRIPPLIPVAGIVAVRGELRFEPGDRKARAQPGRLPAASARSCAVGPAGDSSLSILTPSWRSFSCCSVSRLAALGSESACRDLELELLLARLERI